MYMRSGSLIDVNTDRGSPPLAVYNAPMITEVCAGSCAEAKRKVRATARGVPPPSVNLAEHLRFVVACEWEGGADCDGHVFKGFFACE